MQCMSSRDEHVRGVADGARREDRLLPAFGNYRGLVEGLPLIVYIDGPESGSPSLYVSPQTSAVLGYTPEDWASSPDFFLSILHPDDRERVVAETARMLETGVRLQIEYRVMRPDGRAVWLRDEGVVVHDAEGKPLCIQGYLLDVTELKRSQSLAARTGRAARVHRDGRGAATRARPASRASSRSTPRTRSWPRSCCSTVTASGCGTVPLRAFPASGTRRSTASRSARTSAPAAPRPTGASASP